GAGSGTWCGCPKRHLSLAVVIYEMAAGRVPFDGPTTSDVIVSILEKEPAPLARYAPEAPAELERIVRKALAKDRSERYQTAGEVLIDLKNLNQEIELQARLSAGGPADSPDAGSLTGDGRLAVATSGQLATGADGAVSAQTASIGRNLTGEI